MTSPPSFDLQSHSTYSDGSLTPAQVVAAAAAAGVRLLALTDHDTVDGVDEALAAAAAESSAIRVIPAVEISARDANNGDLHICGYLINPHDAQLAHQLRESRLERQHRAERMCDALRALGWQVDRDELESRRRAGEAIGRPHLAAAVVNDPANRARLERERLRDPSAFLEAYLIEGRPAFRERQAPSVTRVIELIHGAGGIAIWAHPFWDLADDQSVLDTLTRFKELGLDGVEAFYITHTRAQVQLLARSCAELDLISTGSSDFHGPAHRRFNRFRAFATYGLTPQLGRLQETTAS